MSEEYDIRTNLDPGDKPADVVLVGQVNRVLQKHYPGWFWYVEIPPNSGVLIVRNMDTNLVKPWGFVIHLKDIHSDPTFKKVIWAGGELLERYNLARGRVQAEDVVLTHENLNRKAQM